MIALVAPDAAYQQSYLEAVDEFAGAHRDGDGEWFQEADPTTGYAGMDFTRGGLEDGDEFARLVRSRIADADPETPRKAGFVPCTFLWIVEDGDYLGSLAIRHELSDYLLRTGGHIGYSVRPSARRRGVATEALRFALPIARDLGIDSVLVTCDQDNDASRRTIESCGGVFENVLDGQTRRYWIATS